MPCRLLPLLLLPALAVASPRWEAVPFEVPPHAVASGGDAEEYVCRSGYLGGMHAGRFADDFCHIDYGGADLAQTSFEVLVEEDAGAIRWEAARGGAAPAGAFPVGAEPWPSDEPAVIQFACRSDIWLPGAEEGDWEHAGLRLGKLVGEFCNIPMGERVVSAQEYEVLIIDGASRLRPRAPGGGLPGRGRGYRPDGRALPSGAGVSGIPR